jgi:FkbM family methyltransferase
MSSPHGFLSSATTKFHGLVNRLRFERKKLELRVKYKIRGGPVWIDYGWVRLPFYSDGDSQEVYYHLHGELWSQYERDVLRPYLDEGGVAIDVGANLGFITTLLSRMVGQRGMVYSFEPSPTTFRKLQDVIKQNGLTNVQAFNAGCGERPGWLELYCTGTSGHSSLNRPVDSSDVRSIEKVEIVQLDEILASGLSRVDLLKIDTEGHEDSVIAGARELLRRFRPVVYLELTAEYIESSRRAVSLLKAASYRFIDEPVLENCRNGQNFFAVPA